MIRTAIVLTVGAAGAAGLLAVQGVGGAAAAGSGLVAAYGFDEGSGSAVTDASGNGNNGTISNATWTTSGKYGGALAFNGSSALVTIPDSASLHLSSGMTLEAWVYPSSVNSNWRDVIYKANDNFYLEAMSDNASKPDAGLIAGGTYADAYGTAALPANAWSFLTETYDGTTLRLYVNGTQVASTAHTGAIATSTNPLQIGGDSLYGQYFSGLIDNVRVYNVALSAAQIQTDQTTAVTSGPDTTPPSAPGTLTATAASGGEVDLSWGAATDNVGVTGYDIERCAGAACTTFSQIAATSGTGTSYQDTTVSASTSYSYRVRAFDAAGNQGPYSNTAGATTPTPDTTAPSQPGVLSASAVSGGEVDLSWGASTDNVGVTGYKIERCAGAGCSSFTQIAATTGTGTSYKDTSVTSATSYSYRVRATDAAGNLSTYSNTASAATPDVTAPSQPGTLSASAVSGGEVDLSWGASTDNVGVTGYKIERCSGAGCSTFTQIAATTGTGTTYKDTSVSGSTSYSYRVRATDAAGNLSAYSNTATAATPDTTPPSQPGVLSASAVSGGEVDLSWGASTDNVGVTGYKIERCAGAGCSTFTQIAATTGTGTTYKDTTVSASTTYSYRIRATDAAGNLSAYSNTAGATTPTPDTTPPSQPGTLSATPASAAEVDLSWGASSDNVGVTGYKVERCAGAGCSSFTQIAATTGTGTTYKDTTVSASTSYSYRVRATDAAGNLSAYSNTASATTPSGPSGLVAAYAFDEGAGPTATDTSGNGNNGTIGNATWSASGKYGGAMSFNGSSALVTVPDSASLHLSSGMTIEAWVDPSVVNKNWRDVIYKAADNFYLEATSDNASKPDGGLTTGGSNYADAYGSAALPANAWSFLTETYDGSTLRLYVNGTQVASTAHTGTITTSTNALTIGGDNLYGQYFAGLIDNVRIYKVALSAAQIQADETTPVTPAPPPPPDTTPPSQPGTLTASAASSGEVDLSWGASTDNVGVARYLVERCQGSGCSNFTQIGTSTSTSYKDTAAGANSTYSYRVRATDAAGNLSAYSNAASATTPTSLSIQYVSTDANGVASYNFTSSDDGGGTHVLRVLAPTNPAPGVPHNFLYVLPVEPELGTTYGDGLQTLRSVDAQDQYNLTIIEPSFGIDPWYADNPNDPTLHYESFLTQDLVPWVTQNLTPPPATQPLAPLTAAQNWLIGFSKSGIGGEDLLLKHPDIFALAASWDFPADMATYADYGSSSVNQYGTDANFQANYRLTPAFVSAHSAPFLTQSRIWIGGYNTFQADMSDYDALLKSQGIQHATETPQLMAHRWDSGWVPIAVSALSQEGAALAATP